MNNGLDGALGALAIIQNALPADGGDGPTLDELADALDHITLDKRQTRRALAYLATQVWVERRSNEKRAAADATSTLRHLIGELERWQQREEIRQEST